MTEDTQKVVKCASCDKFFGYGEDNTACPFCHTKYGEVIKEKTVSEKKPKAREVPVKIQKESFKIWKGDDTD